MASFASTLRLAKITEADLANSPYDLITEIEAELVNFFENVSLQQKPTFKADRIEIIETGEIITNFTALVVGRFTRGGALHLQLASGDVVAIQILAA